MEHNFEVGQRYKVTGGPEKGNIIEIKNDYGDTCSYCTIKGAVRNGLNEFHVKSAFAEHLEPVSNSNRFEKIVITTDGKTTTAKRYNGNTVVKVAVTRCSPEDNFDFKTGAKIAFDRLIKRISENEKPKYKVGDFVKIKSREYHNHYFPIGTIVEIIDIRDDNDLKCYGYCEGADGHRSFNEQIISPVDIEVIK